MPPKITHRPATPDDADLLVEAVGMAGYGIPERVWAGMASAGESPEDVGRARARRDEGAFSWRNATVFEADGVAVGALVGYRLPDEPEEIGPDFPAEFVPLQELENLAPGSWYVNILGVRPEMRGKGIGQAMLRHAASLAQETGAAGLSMIVFSANPRAFALYEREGYRERARRRMAMPGWRYDGAEAILLVRPSGA